MTGQGLGPLLIKAVGGSAGLRIVGMGFTFLVGLQLARGLGAEGYGIYGLAMSVVSIVGIPTQFGLPQLVTREVAASQAHADYGRLLSVQHWATRIVLIMSFICIAAVATWMILSGKDLGSELSQSTLVGLTLVPLIALGSLKGAALRGMQHIVRGQVSDVLIRPVVFSLLLFALPFLIPLDATSAMAAGAASAGTALIVVWVLLQAQLPDGNKSKLISEDTRGWLSSAWPMALTEGMQVIQAQAAILLLGAMSQLSSVGIYRVASSVALVIALPMTIFSVVTAPMISKLYAERNMVTLQKLLAWVALAMFATTILLTLPFFIAGEFILKSVFGTEFIDSSRVLLIMCVGMVVHGFFGVNAVLLNMTGHHARVTRASAYALVVLVTLMPVMIWGWGEMGAACASAAALAFWSIQMWRDGLNFLHLDSSACILLRKAR